MKPSLGLFALAWHSVTLSSGPAASPTRRRTQVVAHERYLTCSNFTSSIKVAFVPVVPNILTGCTAPGKAKTA